MPEQERSKFLHGAIISLASVIVIGLLNYMVRRTLAVALDERSFGFFYSAYALMLIFISLLDLGLTKSETILISRHRVHGRTAESQAVYQQVFFLKLVGGAAVCLILAIVSPWLLSVYFDYTEGLLTLLLLTLLVPLIAMETASIGAFDAAQAFVTRNMLLILKATVILLVSVACVGIYGTVAASIAFVLGSTVILFTGTLLLSRRHSLVLKLKPRGVTRGLKEVWRFSRWIAVSEAGLVVMYYVDTQMLTVLDSLENVGRYAIAVSVVQIIQSLMILPVIFTPIATEMWQRGRREYISRVCVSMVKILFGFAWLLLMIMLPFAEEVIVVLFSSKYAGAAPALTVLSVGMVCFMMAQFNMNILNVVGRSNQVSLAVSIGVVLNLLMNAILIPRFGIVGAAIATACSYALMAFWSLVLLHKAELLKVPYYLNGQTLVIGVLGSVGAAAVASITDGWFFQLLLISLFTVFFGIYALRLVLVQWRIR